MKSKYRPTNIHYGQKPKYPLTTMSVGESFTVQDAPPHIATYTYARGKVIGRRFSVSRRNGAAVITRTA